MDDDRNPEERDSGSFEKVETSERDRQGSGKRAPTPIELYTNE